MKYIKIIFIILLIVLSLYGVVKLVPEWANPLASKDSVLKALYKNAVNPEKIAPRSIEEYSGSKLLLCSGHRERSDYWEANDRKSNKEWYTVNDNPHQEPDYLANLLLPESYGFFPSNKFSLVVDEYCPYDVSNEIRKHISRSIKKGGILISKYCGKYEDLPTIKEEFKSSGFSRAVVSALPDEGNWIYRMKQKSLETILKIFLKYEVKAPQETSKCVQGQWYDLVAIK